MTQQHATRSAGPVSLPDVVFDALIDGLTELHLIRLPAAPPAKGLPNVAMTWEKALLARGTWRENTAAEDAWRLQQGFAALLATTERWPLPVNLLEHLPPRNPPPPLPQPKEQPISAAEREAFFKELFTHMKMDKD